MIEPEQPDWGGATVIFGLALVAPHLSEQRVMLPYLPSRNAVGEPVIVVPLAARSAVEATMIGPLVAYFEIDLRDPEDSRLRELPAHSARGRQLPREMTRDFRGLLDRNTIASARAFFAGRTDWLGDGRLLTALRATIPAELWADVRALAPDWFAHLSRDTNRDQAA